MNARHTEERNFVRYKQSNLPNCKSETAGIVYNVSDTRTGPQLEV